MKKIFIFLTVTFTFMTNSAFAEGINYQNFDLLVDDVASHQYSCQTEVGSFGTPTLRVKQFKKGVSPEIQIMSADFDQSMDAYAYQVWNFVLIAHHPYYHFNEATNSIEGIRNHVSRHESIFKSLGAPVWFQYTTAYPHGFPYKMYGEDSYVIIPRQKIYSPGENIQKVSFELSQDRKSVKKVSISIFTNQVVNDGNLFEPVFRSQPEEKILSVSCSRK